MSNDSSIRSQRNLGMDALRGLAVLLMIEQHVGIWLWKGALPGESSWDYPFLLAFNALGGGAAPLFIALAGMGSSIFVYRRLAALKDPDGIGAVARGGGPTDRGCTFSGCGCDRSHAAFGPERGHPSSGCYPT